MHDSPIMMSGPMVLACLRQVRGGPGGKTQTRRMPTKQWDALERRTLAGESLRLWVREAICNGGDGAIYKPVIYRADEVVEFGAGEANHNNRWTPAIHMPRWASRLTLLDVTIRRERLGDISEADARAEGLTPSVGGWWSWRLGSAKPTAVGAYEALWKQIHGSGSWRRDRDKEVMVIGFRPVLANIDQIGGAA